MKIVVATSRPFHLFHLARELALLGQEVIIYSYIPDLFLKKYSLKGVEHRSLFWRLFPYSLAALQGVSPALRRWATASIMRHVDYRVAREVDSCDVFIGLSGVISTAFSIIKNKYNCLVVCDRGSSHVLTQNTILHAHKEARISTEYIDREMLGYETSDYVVVPSIFAKNSFINNEFPEDKLFVNNYGVDLNRFSTVGKKSITSASTNSINALFVGGWSYQKGCDIFSEALQCAPNFYLTHIGTRVDVAFPENNRFKSLGHVDNKILPEYYKQYDLLILPSRQDGFGMVLLEALASGLPVIASENTGAPDIASALINKAGVILMNEVSPKNLLIALESYQSSRFNSPHAQIFTDLDTRHFTWQMYAARYLNFLKKSLKKRAS